MKNNNNYNERDIRNGTGHALPTVNNNDFFIYSIIFLFFSINFYFILINSLIANYINDDINQFELSK